MKKTTSSELTPEQQAELAALANLSDAEIDTQDIPETQDWQQAQRGLFYRPIKQQITLRLDADLIAWFKAHSEMADGKGYQTTINQALRDYVNQHTATQ